MPGLRGGSEQGAVGGLEASGAGRTSEFKDSRSEGCAEETVWSTSQGSV